MDFDLRLLRHARALAEEGNFARAARTLHLTQPALSRSIQELERRTGLSLFDRNKGRVELTELGNVFLAHARELLGRAEALDRDVALLRGTGTGRLVVGSGTFPTVMFMPEALSTFLRRNPGVGVRLVNDNWAVLVAGLRRRDLDFVVAAPPSPAESSGIDVRPLSLRQGYFLVRPGHPLLARQRPGLVDVVACPIICAGRLTAAITDCLLGARQAADTGRPIPDVACESHEMMREIAKATDHVLLSSLAANARALAAGELVVLPLVEPGLGVAFSILRLTARTLAPIADELIQLIVAADANSRAMEEQLAARLGLLVPIAAAADPRPKRPRPARDTARPFR